MVDGVVATDSTMSAEEVEAAIVDALEIADIDDNGEVDALTDGLLLLRYLFGLTDNSLTINVINTNANRTTNEAIKEHLDKYMPSM